MYLAPLLHIYQPPTQFKKVLENITKESYSKIVKILKRNSTAKLTLNICASLTEQLVANFPQIIKELVKLAKKGQLEFTGTAAYHPLLSKLPKSEIVRQIELNNQLNKKYFGQVFAPTGFFPPEMAYSPQVGDVIENLGFSWVVLEEYAYPGQYIARDKIFKRQGKNLLVFFRERDLSLKIAFSQINSIPKLAKYLGQELTSNGYLITAMDGETFGHHRPGLEKFLEKIFQFQKLPSIKISQIRQIFSQVEEVEPQVSSWGISEADCRAGRIYPRWDLPGNPLHSLQWQLTNLAIKSVSKIKDDKGKARNLLDRALHSDQYWWASHNPNWHYKMVTKGAEMLSSVVEISPKAKVKDKIKAKNLAKKIANLGLALYGDTVIES